MKFTGIVASLAIASTATAAALPNLDVVKVQETVTHLDAVIGDIDGVLGGAVNGVGGTVGGVVCGGSSTSVLSETRNELSGIHDLLNGLVGSVVGTVESSELVRSVLDTVGPIITNVVDTIGLNDQNIADFGILSEKLVGGIKSGVVDETGLQNLLTVVGGETGLANLNKLLSQSR
ncbi:uncharacterized protein BDV17DRAFT_296808 [Aspergillus undulatus]|uniref:uncharacterized protein n=1 Tax=Aspergillus undulatus TaxID=1810928 RepID=UPI003CCD5FDF